MSERESRETDRASRAASGPADAAAAAPLGKLAPGALRDRVLAHLGAARDDVVLGPAPGVDAALVELGDGNVLALTTDPLSLVPAIGIEASARLAAHLVASDLWTTGIAPAWAAVTLNLPPHLSDADLERYAAALGAAWRELGVAVVTGHTGRYAGCDLTIVGACTLAGVGDAARTVSPAHARAGDRVIVTKGCAVEATALAAWIAPGRLAAHAGTALAKAAREWLARVSVVEDCRAVLGVGVRDQGVAMLHDATEGGVLGGLLELAAATGLPVHVAREKIPLAPEARAACAMLGIDPWWTLSEGTLLACVRPAHAAAVLAALAARGIEAADIGQLADGAPALHVQEPGGAITHLTDPQPDPWWPAYERALREGWR